MSDTTHNHISNQTVTELTSAARLLLRTGEMEDPLRNDNVLNVQKKEKEKQICGDDGMLLWLITCDVGQLKEINNLHFNNIIIIS